MSAIEHIYGVTLNHNTSHFVELMLRTLFLTNQLDTFDLTMTILDNASDDDQLPALRSYLDTRRVSVQQTGFDTAIAVEKHGAALQAFVMQHPECSHYLFLDSDMWFVERDTIGTMLHELDGAGPDVFGNQARIAGYYAGRIIEGHGGVPGAGDPPTWQTTYDGRTYVTSITPRCSPVCSLIKNTPLFRRVVEIIGFTPIRRLHFDRELYYDTFGLMTSVMQTHQQRFIVSSKTINHFTQATYMPEHRAPKDRDCLLLLGDLRAGRGMGRANFYESDWVKQQRQSPP